MDSTGGSGSGVRGIAQSNLVAVAAALLAASGAAGALTFIYLIIAARFLGPARYADLAALIATIALGTTATGGLTLTAAYKAAILTSRGRTREILPYAREMLTRITIAAALGLTLGIALTRPLALALRLESLIGPFIALATVGSNAVLGVARGFLRGSGRFTEYALGVGLEGLARVGFGVLAILWLGTTNAAIAPYLVASLLVLGLSLVQLRRPEQPYPQRGEATTPMPAGRRAASFSVLVLLGAVLQNVDLLWVKWSLPSREAGIYAAAVTAARVVTLLMAPLDSLILPSLAGRSPQERGSTIRTLMKVGTAIALPLILAFFLAGDEISRLVYGERFEGAGRMFGTLALGFVALQGSWLLGQIMVADGRRFMLPILTATAILDLAVLEAVHPSAEQAAILIPSIHAAALGVALVFARIRREALP